MVALAATAETLTDEVSTSDEDSITQGCYTTVGKTCMHTGNTSDGKACMDA